MFKGLHFKTHPMTLGENGVPFGIQRVLIAKFPLPFIYVVLKLKSERRLGFFNDEVWIYLLEKCSGRLRCANPTKTVSVGLLGTLVSAESPTELLLKGFDKRAVRVCNTDMQKVTLVNGVWSGRPEITDEDAPLTVEEAGHVFYIHMFSLVSDGMAANSGDTRCPAREGAEGQSRAKQRGGSPSGVCNDQVPPSKEKVWSDLARDRKEAQASDHVGILPQIQHGCNTKYVFFYTDPMMMFRWTEPRTWPNQVVDIRLLLLRLSLIYTSRMFLGVIDGFTA